MPAHWTNLEEIVEESNLVNELSEFWKKYEE